MTGQAERELEEVKQCPLCGSETSECVFKKGFYDGKQCGKCGMIFITPRLKDQRSLYTDDKSSSTSKYYSLSYSTDRRTFDRRLELLEKYSASNSSILDIGCSTGAMLDAAKSRGWKNATGVEPNPVSAGECRKKGGNVINRFFDADAARQMPGQFDAVHAGDVIEHLKDPNEFVRGAFEVLKDDGVLMIVTPDYESSAAKFFQVKPDEHLLYFTRGTLRFALEKNGFSVKYIGRAARERSFKALPYSTTFKSGFMKIAVKILYITGLSILINMLIKALVKDELIAIGRKKGK